MVIISNENTLKVKCVDQKIILINNESRKGEEILIESNNTIQDELNFFINSCQTKQMISLPYPNSEIGKNILEVVLQAEAENFDKR